MQRIDLTGQRFGRLVAREYVGAKKWRCACDCGRESRAKSDDLKKGHTQSCGCARGNMADQTGQRFGKLVAVALAPSKRHRRYLCRCDCGGEVVASQNQLTSARSSSCGCDYASRPINDGERFGKLIVLGSEARPDKRRRRYLCRCDCGAEVHTEASKLRGGLKTSCNSCKVRKEAPELITAGERFNGLVALRRVKSDKPYREWLCRCDCGTEKVISVGALRAGAVKSCGCQQFVHVGQLAEKRWQRIRGDVPVTPQNELQRAEFTREFATAIKYRDRFTCYLCGGGGHVHAHHIASWSAHPELRFNPLNVATLCDECHSARAHDGWHNIVPEVAERLRAAVAARHDPDEWERLLQLARDKRRARLAQQAAPAPLFACEAVA